VRWEKYQTLFSEEVSGCGGELEQRREKHREEHTDASSALAVTVSYTGECCSLQRSESAAALRQIIRIIH